VKIASLRVEMGNPGERRQEMSGQKDKPMPDIAFKFTAWMLGIMRDRFQNPRAKLERVGIREGQTVLDFGCGIGSFAFPAAQIVGERGKAYALDIHPLAIEAVEKKAKKEKLTNITAILSDGDTGLPDESIDVILLYDTIHMIKAKQALLEELHRVLKPDGFLSVWAPHQPKVNKAVEIVQENGLFSLREQDKKLLSFKKRISSKS
jgi:ubiquinone/menaquinone biosynthesis C-methylase UbiE